MRLYAEWNSDIEETYEPIMREYAFKDLKEVDIELYNKCVQEDVPIWMNGKPVYQFVTRTSRLYPNIKTKMPLFAAMVYDRFMEIGTMDGADNGPWGKNNQKYFVWLQMNFNEAFRALQF
jgi:hypothetical protein